MSAKTKNITKAAVIAALYAALTYVSGVFGLAYGPVQFRLSEMLTVLPLFTPAAIPGLAVGCFAANILSTVNPADMAIGTAATLLAAVLSRRLKNVTISGYPFLSFLSPVLLNALFIGAETALFSSGAAAEKAFITAFCGVFAGEAAVCFIPGTFLFRTIRKNRRLAQLTES